MARNYINPRHMKKFLLISILPLITGCIYQTVDEVDLKLANDLCKNNEGVKSLHRYVGVATNVICKDGTKFSYTAIGKDLSIENEAKNLKNPNNTVQTKP